MSEKMLRGMIEDLNQHHRSKPELLTYHVNKRLTKSLQNYYHDLMEAYNNLVRKDAAKILNKVFPSGGAE